MPASHTLGHLRLWFGKPEEPGVRARSRESDAPDLQAFPDRPAEREAWSPVDLADLALVTKIGAGDERAFRTLYDTVYPALWNFARSLTESRAGADDLAQDAMVLLWERASSWNPHAHVRGFLFTAVRLQANNRARRAKVAAHTANTQAAHVAALAMGTVPATPHERIAHQELIDAVGRAVADLPEARRMALLLRWREQLPYEEIARVLQISVTAAQHLVTRARTAVRQKIAPYLAE